MAVENRPKLSIIVPVYNPGECFVPCLESLASQTLDPSEFEVILVDDGSDDGAEAVCDDWASRLANWTVIHEAPSGFASKPRNAGIDAATGEYLLFHDADDVLYPEACKRLVTHAEEWNSDVLAFSYCFYYPKTGERHVVPKHAREGGLSLPACERFAEPIVNTLNARKLFRRSLVEGAHIKFQEVYSEDFLFAIEALSRAKVVSFACDYVYEDYVQNASSVVHSGGDHPMKTFEKRLEGIQRILHVLDERGVRGESERFLLPMLFRHSVYKLLTTSIDVRGWATESKKMPSLRKALEPYWSMDIAGRVPFKEAAVIEALMSEGYAAVPAVRGVAKLKCTNIGTLKSSGDNAVSMPKCVFGGSLTGFDSRVVRGLFQRQFERLDIFNVVAERQGWYVMGMAQSKCAIFAPDELEFSIDGGGTWSNCSIACAPNPENPSKLTVFWWGAVESFPSSVSLGFKAGGNVWAIDDVELSAKTRGWATMSDGTFRGRLVELRAFFDAFSDAPDGVLERFAAMVLDGPAYTVITSAINAGDWANSERSMPDLRNLVIPYWRDGVIGRMKFVEKRVLGALVAGDFHSIPQVREAAFEELRRK